jgi:hypothetical protein
VTNFEVLQQAEVDAQIQLESPRWGRSLCAHAQKEVAAESGTGCYKIWH